MIGPKLPEGWVPASVRHKRELYNLRRNVDGKATTAHHFYLEFRLGPMSDPHTAEYYRGRADAFSEVFHCLSVMRGFPW